MANFTQETPKEHPNPSADMITVLHESFNQLSNLTDLIYCTRCDTA